MVYEYLTKYQSSSQPDTPEGKTNTEDTRGRGLHDTKVAILRHDVDRKIKNALQMAELEHDLGIQSSYYFRYPYTFKPEIIKQIQSLGHEIGYHYETLSKAKGDLDKAAALFEEELAAFRNICEVKTICMHGSPLSPHDNRDLWEKYDFQKFNINGEAYLSITGKNLRYLTDTGRNWNGKNSMRDVMSSAQAVPVDTTIDLIKWIEYSHEKWIYLTVHPERWALNKNDWIIGTLSDSAVNMGKKIIHMVRK